MANRKSAYCASTGFLMLAIACVGTVSLCGWFVTWCLQGMHLKQFFMVALLTSIATLTAVWQIWKTSRYTRKMMYATTVSLPAQLHEHLAQQSIDASRVLIIQTEEPLAFCFGFLKPQICLSTGLIKMLSPSQLQAVLCHEDYHRRHFDPLRILVIKSISKALFFLPFVREWCRIFEIKLELDADRYAVQQTSRPALAGALHRLLTAASPSYSPIASNAVTAGLSANTARIAALLGERTKPERVTLKSLISSSLILWVICLLLMV